MSEISWIKLKTEMFEDEKIKLIESMPESDSILIIWIRLLALAGKTNDDGQIYLQRNMPYTDEMLATLFGKKINVVKLSLKTLEKFNMISIQSDGTLEIMNWEKHQNVDGLNRIKKLDAKRAKRYRERKKLEADNSNPSRDASRSVTLPVTLRHATDKDSDSDKELEEHKTISPAKAEPQKDDFNYAGVIQYLNEQSGKKFRNTETNQKLIKARLNEGFGRSDIKAAIDNVVLAWKDNPDMVRYIQPSTIFRASKFEGYVNAPPYSGSGKQVNTRETLPDWAKDDYSPETQEASPEQLASIEARMAKLKQKEDED